MNLEEQVRQISNPQEFTDLCNTIFTEKHKEDFLVIDGTRGDEGNDGYVVSEKRIFAIYCPIKPENKTDKDYQDKITKDLAKAKKLHDSGKFEVKKWTFVTPGKLSNEIIASLIKEAKKFGFDGNYIEATFLANELYAKQHLLEKFPRLHVLKIETQLDEIGRGMKELIKEKAATDTPISLTKSTYEQPDSKYVESEDFKKVFIIRHNEQTETSKSDLKVIFYKTTDKVAQVNAILGLLKWYDPLDDKNEDMVDWCDQGIAISDRLKNKSLRAIFLASKGYYLSEIFSKEDMQAAFNIRIDNMIGISTITEEQRQEKLKRLRVIEEQFISAFTEALDVAMEIKNLKVLAQIHIKIGNAAGGRYLHLNHFGVKERANLEKALSKRALLMAKELFSAIEDELSVGYAIHNLANQLNIFGEKKEAMNLTKAVVVIAKKYNDASLLQTANWLEESLTTGKILDYAHGERHELKK